MEVGPGVFVTAASTDEWQAHPHPAGEIHVLCRGVDLSAGLWRSVDGITPEYMEWTAPSREVKIVLEGALRVEISDGTTLELKAGDIASFPRGMTAKWYCSSGYKELWILDEPGAGD
jgi:uncharacterized cupin superfamily protein